MFRVILIALVSSSFLVVGVSAQDSTKGEKIYGEQKCALCHSVGDKGNKKGPLDDVGSRLKPEEIRQWMVDAAGMTEKTKSARKPIMKAYSLPKDELDALVAYMVSLKKK